MIPPETQVTWLISHADYCCTTHFHYGHVTWHWLMDCNTEKERENSEVWRKETVQRKLLKVSKVWDHFKLKQNENSVQKVCLKPNYPTATAGCPCFSISAESIRSLYQVHQEDWTQGNVSINVNQCNCQLRWRLVKKLCKSWLYVIVKNIKQYGD